MTFRAIACAAGLATAPFAVWAEAPVLSLPVDCALGRECFIQNYVDDDAGAGHADFACGRLSYDGHKGTDFAVATQAQMRAGWDVLAMADGVVAGVRNAMPDELVTEATRARVAGRECGNGVVLRHSGGWETQYCHLAQGSVTVRPGQQIVRGTPLGQIGLSGLTEFPHVHVAVRHNGAVVDPFDPENAETCGVADQTLWEVTPDYIAGAMLDTGFADQVPAYAAVKQGTAAVPLTRRSAAMVLFGYAFGGRAGDVVAIRIDGPDGNVIDTSSTLDRDQAQFFRAAGRKAPRGGWAAGAYRGTVTLIRDGAAISMRSSTITLSR